MTFTVTLEASASAHNEWEPLEVAVLTFVNRDDELSVFEGVGDLSGGESESHVSAASASAEVLVGASVGANGLEAFRYTSTLGLVGLGGASSRAADVSPDGTLAVGSATKSDGTSGGALWYEDGELEFLRGGPDITPGLPPLFSIGDPTVVLDDGRVYGSCTQYAAYGEPLGCRLDAPGSITLLVPTSHVFAADEAGNFGGDRIGSRNEPIRSVAMLNQVELGYPERSPCLIPHDCQSAVRAFTPDLSVVVGTSSVPPPSDDPAGPETPLRDTAFVYTEGNMLRLSDLEGGDEASGAYAVSPDGRLIAGFGTDASGRKAVVWVDRVPVALEELLHRGGDDPPAGWVLHEVRAISSDGRSFAGNGTNPQGDAEGFRVVLPAPIALE